MGTSSPDTVSRAGHVDATAGDAVEVDDHGDAVALAVELLLEERDRVIDGGADIGIVDDGLGRRTASRRSVRPPRPQSRSPNNPTVIELGRFMMLNASGLSPAARQTFCYWLSRNVWYFSPNHWINLLSIVNSNH
jgi:hypothetical protein